MRVLNFSHPLNDSHKQQLRALTGHELTYEKLVVTHFDGAQPYGLQVESLVEGLAITSEEWQTMPWLIVPPSFAPIAAVLTAELHGRMGYFPSIVRLRPVLNSLPPMFEVAEIIDLNTIRANARERRDTTSSSIQ